tara:strand:- start:275 stop:754 length:480 start_codon:yes stop_codon:yes gene_type:complete
MTILLIRHGSAGDPYRWSGDDAERPLDATGTDQATCLADHVDGLLAGRPLTGIRSSRAVRCLQTVGPTAGRHGLLPETDPSLFEGASSAMIELVRGYARAENADRQVIVLCSHSDVIPDVIRNLVSDGAGLSGGRGCAYASIWELTVANGAIMHAHYHE